MSGPVPIGEDTCFLESAPPHWAANGLSYVLLALVLTAGAAAVVVRVPERITAGFVLVPMTGADPIRAPRGGRVTAIHVREGALVAARQPVLRLQSEDAGDRFAELAALEARLQGVRTSVENLSTREESQRRANAQERERLERRASYLDRALAIGAEQLRLKQDEVERYRRLHAEGVAGETDLRAREIEVNRARLEFEETRNGRAENRILLEKLRFEGEARAADAREQVRRLEEDARAGEIRAEALRRDLEHTSGNEETVLAPCSGTVVGLHVQGPGAIVAPGEPLCQIACQGDHFEADLILPQSGLDRVRVGQVVRLLYDAFPYQRYGIKSGEVRWVSPAPVSGPNGSAFHARVAIEESTVRVGDGIRRLQPGMGGRADIVVGRRTLISFAFEPLRQLRESFREGR